MRRILGVMLALLGLCASAAWAGVVDDTALETPDAFGDQVIYYYDARPGFTTFITLSNGSDTDRTINLLFYNPTVSLAFSKNVTISRGRLTIIDVGALRDDGLASQAGVAIATAVNDAGQPIVTKSLAGNFTVANLLTGSAFGAPGAARLALKDNADTLNPDDVIGQATGSVLQLIRPQTALLAAYYDPNSLAPVSSSGNQLIFINFEDSYEPTYAAIGASTVWRASASGANGFDISNGLFAANGVTVTDLASVAGAGVNGAAGRITFFLDSDSSPKVNRLVYFAESLGTFGTGYLLPPLRLRRLGNK